MPISRKFQSAQDAAAATEDLKQAGFGRLPIDLDSADGGTLLTIDAPFGMAGRVIAILEKPRAGDSGPVTATETARPAPVYDDGPDGLKKDGATPLSSALGWRVLSHDPAPFSNWLGWTVLSAEQRGRGALARKQTSSGGRLLSDKPALLSESLGLRVLSPQAAPLSSAAKWKTSLPDPAPLSGRIGFKTLLRDPAPLSSALGLPTLLRTKR
jgi:hypothetical protein